MNYLPVFLDPGSVQKLVNFSVLITPLFSYGLTSYQIFVKKTTKGFSIDVCLLMLISSIFKIVYYWVSPYEVSLYRQALIMVFIQCVLLNTALKYMEKPVKLYDNEKILSSSSSTLEVAAYHLRIFDNLLKRPFEFWQWFDQHLKFWEFLVLFSLAVCLATLCLGTQAWFVATIGFLGLFIESLLPLPQILLMHRIKLVKNFKWILIISWLSGDFIKINYLLFGTSEVSRVFILAALFQTSLDLFVTGQFFYYRNYESTLPV